MYADAERIRLFKASYPELVQESRNLILGGCGDGVSPFDKATKNISMNCLVFTVFNLPAQIRSKYANLLVWGIYEGLHSKHVHMHQFLVEDLKFVSKGFVVYDSFMQQDFTCCAKVLAFTADIPGQGDLSQQKGVAAGKGCYKCALVGCQCACLKKNLYALKLQGDDVNSQADLTPRTHASITADSDSIEVSTHTPQLLHIDCPNLPKMHTGNNNSLKNGVFVSCVAAFAQRRRPL
jgi:hypothetical protein